MDIQAEAYGHVKAMALLLETGVLLFVTILQHNIRLILAIMHAHLIAHVQLFSKPTILNRAVHVHRLYTDTQYAYTP